MAALFSSSKSAVPREASYMAIPKSGIPAVNETVGNSSAIGRGGSLVYEISDEHAIFSWHLLPALVLYLFWVTIQHWLVISLFGGNLLNNGTLAKPIMYLVTAFLFGVIYYPSGLLIESSLRASLQGVNATLESYEKLETAVILQNGWTVENGLMTPTLKNKRNEIEKLYLARYPRWYHEPGLVVWG
ncbi:MAG TPA: hypothetical protein DCE81_05850 [Cytophagales bacterium]|nr:hypothetical protein [Cytophagales bacterium]